MTPEDKLEKALNELASREKDLEQVLTRDAEAEHEYKVQYAKAFLKAEGTVDERKSRAAVETEKFLKDHLTRQAQLVFVKTKIKDAQDAVSARQSLLSAALRTNSTFSR
jgi:hypothetical protein